MIAWRSVSKRYPGATGDALSSLTLEVAPGHLLALVGGSGSGKTTAVKLVNRLHEATSGVVEVDGRDVRSVDAVTLRRSVGYVLQKIALFPHWTVGENVAVVPRLLGWAPARIAERVDALLDRVGLPAADYRDRYPGALSGGQQQRVGVARALAGDPKVLLMDEPFGALDPVTRDRLQAELRALHDALGLTTVLVTHDMAEALLLADRIAVMRDGRLVQHGSPSELLSAPADPYVSELLEAPRRHAARVEALVGR